MLLFLKMSINFILACSKLVSLVPAAAAATAAAAMTIASMAAFAICLHFNLHFTFCSKKQHQRRTSKHFWALLLILHCRNNSRTKWLDTISIGNDCCYSCQSDRQQFITLVFLNLKSSKAAVFIHWKQGAICFFSQWPAEQRGTAKKKERVVTAWMHCSSHPLRDPVMSQSLVFWWPLFCL